MMMSSPLPFISLCILIAACLLFLTLQVTLLRFRGYLVYASIIMAFAWGEVFLLAASTLLWLSGSERALGYFCITQFTYLFLAYNYFAFITLNVTSLRYRIVKKIYIAGGPYSYEALLQTYSAKSIAGIRLERMLNATILGERDGRYVLLRFYPLIPVFVITLLRKLILRAKTPPWLPPPPA